MIRSSVFFIWFSWLDRFKVFVNVMGGFNLDNHDMGKNKREEEEARWQQTRIGHIVNYFVNDEKGKDGCIYI